MKKNRIRELYQRYVGALETWQIKLAIARIRHFGIPPDSWEDTMQELAIVIHQFRFDPHKAHAASEETILCRAIDNRIKMLARGNARRLAMLDRLGRMNQQTEDARLPEDAAAEAEVREAVRQLTPQQQEICRSLMNGQSIYQISRRTGRAYDTIKRHVLCIRRIFTDRGLDPWSA